MINNLHEILKSLNIPKKVDVLTGFTSRILEEGIEYSNDDVESFRYVSYITDIDLSDLNLSVPKLKSTVNKTLNVGVDAEWTQESDTRNMILSYQFTTHFFDVNNNYKQVYFVAYPTRNNRLSVKRLLSIFLNEVLLKNFKKEFSDINLASRVRRNSKGLSKNQVNNLINQNRYEISLNFHFGRGDMAAFYDKEFLMKNCVVNQGVGVTTRAIRTDIYNSSRNYQYLNINIRDTFLLTSDERSLEKLGKSLGLDKVDNEYIEKMDYLMVNDFKKYLEYSISDALITLLWTTVFTEGEINTLAPITIGSEAVKLTKESIMSDEDWSNEEFNSEFLGLDRKLKRTEKSGRLNTSYEYQLNNNRLLVEGIASAAFFGGRNEAFVHGVFTEYIYDFDLIGAYTTALSMLSDVDFTQLPAITQRKELKTSDITSILDYVIADVSFKFPETTSFPCLPIRDAESGGLVFVLEGRTFACAPELKLALEMGAEIYAHTMYTIESKNKRSYFNVLKEFNTKRNDAALKFGKGSSTETAEKLKGNAVYGKLGQGLAGKRNYNPSSNKMEEVPVSELTNPVLVSMTTSLVRAAVTEYMMHIKDAGYEVLSVTTDGFLTSIPEEEILKLKPKVIIPYFESLRHEFDGNSQSITKKHEQNWTLLVRTRGNLTHVADGANARAGYKFNHEQMKLEKSERYTKLIHEVLSREGRIVNEYTRLPSFKDILLKDIDMIAIPTTKRLRFDYDFKRSPEEVFIEDITYDNKEYSVLKFNTKPYKNLDDYTAGRKAYMSLEKVQNLDDLLKFELEYEAKKSGVITYNKNIESLVARSLINKYHKSEIDAIYIDNKKLSTLAFSRHVLKELNLDYNVRNFYDKSIRKNRNVVDLPEEVLNEYSWIFKK